MTPTNLGHRPSPPPPAVPGTAGPDITVDGTGLLCVTLLLRLREDVDGAAPGTVVHVIATAAAPLGLPAWCHLTGHHYLGPVHDDPANRSVYALRLVSGAHTHRPDAPWRGAEA